MYLWKQWQRDSARFVALVQLGISKDLVWRRANFRKGVLACCW